MKKILILTTLLLLLVAITACGGDKAKTTTAPQTTESAPTTTAASTTTTAPITTTPITTAPITTAPITTTPITTTPVTTTPATTVPVTTAPVTTVPVTTTPVTTDDTLVTAYDDPESYVTLPALSEIKVSNATVKAEVDKYLASVLNSMAREDFRLVQEGSAAILGDKLNIHYTGRAKDPSVTLPEQTLARLSNASQTEGYDLVLGSGSFIPGFEEGLVGAKSGETVTVDVTFPDNYSEDLRNVAILFDVTVNSIKRATVSDKSILLLTVIYTADSTVENSDLAAFLEGHETEFDLRDLSTAFDEHFAAEEVKIALLGKNLFEKIEVTLTMLPEKAASYGYENGLTVSATITVEQIVVYPEEFTDEDINAYTGGEYTTVDAFVTYVNNYYKSYYAYEEIEKAVQYGTPDEKAYTLLYQSYYNKKLYSLIGDTSNMTEEELAQKLTAEIKKQAEDFATENATLEYNDRMLFAYLVKKTGFVLTEELYQTELKALYDYNMKYYGYQMVMMGITTVEKFEAYFGRDALETQFTTDGIFESLPTLVSYID